MAAIREAGGYVSFDPNIRPDLWPDENALHGCLEQALQSADVVKLSVEELAFFTGSAEVNVGLEVLMRAARRVWCWSPRKRGVTAWHEGTVKHYPATPVQCVDTTGAGDAFVAGLLYGLAAGQDLTPVIALAQRCGALATTAKGAMTALPWQHDL
jgi:fructokinase